MAKTTTKSPFAPKALTELDPLDGARSATAEAGIRYKGRTDLMVAVMDEGTSASEVHGCAFRRGGDFAGRPPFCAGGLAAGPVRTRVATWLGSTSPRARLSAAAFTVGTSTTLSITYARGRTKSFS